jgi:hypothetical protein
MSKSKAITKSKPLTPEQYAEMKTRYQMGDAIREIARDFNYDSGNLTRRFKKEGIVQGELQHLIDKKVIAAAESIKTITADIQQITSPLQEPIIQNKLNERAAKWLGIVEDVTDIALKLNKNLLIEVSNRSKPDAKNKYEPHQSAAILRTLGMSHDKLLEQTGISAKSNAGDDSEKAKPVVLYIPDNKRSKR